MLAEIFLLRLEATARAAKEAATITRSTSPFVPVTLPVPTPKAAEPAGRRRAKALSHGMKGQSNA